MGAGYGSGMPAVVLLLPTTSYRADDFLAAAARLGVEVIVASDRCQVLAEAWPLGSLPLQLRDAEAAAELLSREVRADQPLAVIGVDDQTALVAALASAQLGLPHNPPEAVQAARNKLTSREKLREAGLPVPWFRAVERDGLVDLAALEAPYPCVVKPLVLSASRGVIRADDLAGLEAAHARVAALLRSPRVAERRDPALQQILIEEFIPGPEVALEGLLQNGRLHVLALFDKPDPLDGPFFEETLYVTPSRWPAPLQAQIAQAATDAAAALGLREGPIHAELRLSPLGPRILEVAARSIGGLCGRALRFGVGVSLEELLLRHALEPGALPPLREARASGVLMLPIGRGGVLQEVRGVEAARAVPGVTELVITAHLHEELLPLPEGASYLGFAFARGETPAEVEAALRAAGALIDVRVAPKLF